MITRVQLDAIAKHIHAARNEIALPLDKRTPSEQKLDSLLVDALEQVWRIETELESAEIDH